MAFSFRCLPSMNINTSEGPIYNGAGANKRIKTHWENLSTHSDWDGYLTLEEANEWYQTGNGEPLFVDLSKIDSGIVSLGEKFVGSEVTFNLLTNGKSLNDGLVYGRITLKHYPDNRARAYADKYDFDMKSWRNLLNWRRNLETIIGQKVAGQGESYEINIYGSKKLKPLLLWLK